MKKAFLLLIILVGIIADITSPTATPKRVFSLFRQILPQATPIPSSVTLIAAGDVMLGRSINFKSAKNNDFLWPFTKTANFLKSTDLTFINLESPLIENCPLTNTGMIFCADPKNIAGLTYAGVDIANLANNHTLNYSQAGLESTIKILNDNQIQTIGVKETVFKEINGIRLAFLGYSQFSQLPDIAGEISQAREQADSVVVSFHWGEEYTDKPTVWQKKYARLAIDSGADLIIGHHPHWVQPTEIYQNKLIVYSLGNFIFDQGWSEKTMQGVIGKFTFTNNGLSDYRLLPVRISPDGQPEIIYD